MAIANLNDVELTQILNDHLTPSKEILNEDRLFGREVHLRQIARALGSEGRNIFIFGDRGIGKTSVARTAAKLHNFAGNEHIYIPCGQTSSFGDVIQAIGYAEVPVEQRFEQKRVAGGLNIGYGGVGVGGNYTGSAQTVIPKPGTVTEALDVINYVGQKRRFGRSIIVIDEFDRIANPLDKLLFAELIKNLPTQSVDVRFIFCGIGRSVEDILGAHPSAGRYFEPVELKRLQPNDLWAIINAVAERTGVQVPYEMLWRIALVSDGFPHFVHLIGKCLFYAVHDDPETVTECRRSHYEAGVKQALLQTDPDLSRLYRLATEKTKNSLEYAEALWALADRAETRRQVAKIYEDSYRRITRAAVGDVMTQTELNQRLLTLRKPSHGEVVRGHGSGYFSFRESVLRGYVRLKAETEGVELISDPV